jgi:hypothetical protein
MTRDMTKISAGQTQSIHSELQIRCGTQAHEVAILALSGIVCGSITVILHALKAFLSRILAVQIFLVIFDNFQQKL